MVARAFKAVGGYGGRSCHAAYPSHPADIATAAAKTAASHDRGAHREAATCARQPAHISNAASAIASMDHRTPIPSMATLVSPNSPARAVTRASTRHNSPSATPPAQIACVPLVLIASPDDPSLGGRDPIA